MCGIKCESVKKNGIWAETIISNLECLGDFFGYLTALLCKGVQNPYENAAVLRSVKIKIDIHVCVKTSDG